MGKVKLALSEIESIRRLLELADRSSEENVRFPPPGEEDNAK